MIADVSCDPYGTYNPVPVYDRCTTFEEPCLEIIAGDTGKGVWKRAHGAFLEKTRNIAK